MEVLVAEKAMISVAHAHQAIPEEFVKSISMIVIRTLVCILDTVWMASMSTFVNAQKVGRYDLFSNLLKWRLPPFLRPSVLLRV